MEEEYLVYLKENNPELYDQAISSLSWAAKWRDDKIKTLDDWNEEQAAEIDRLKQALDDDTKSVLSLVGEIDRLKELLKEIYYDGGSDELSIALFDRLRIVVKGEPHD